MPVRWELAARKDEVFCAPHSISGKSGDHFTRQPWCGCTASTKKRVSKAVPVLEFWRIVCCAPTNFWLHRPELLPHYQQRFQQYSGGLSFKDTKTTISIRLAAVAGQANRRAIKPLW